MGWDFQHQVFPLQITLMLAEVSVRPQRLVSQVFFDFENAGNGVLEIGCLGVLNLLK